MRVGLRLGVIILDRFGRDFIIDVATPGAVLGELALDDSETYSSSAEALTEAQLSFLPREGLARFIERHPTTGVRLVATLSTALARARRQAGDLALKRADARLADLLLRLAERPAGAEPVPGRPCPPAPRAPWACCCSPLAWSLIRSHIAISATSASARSFR